MDELMAKVIEKSKVWEILNEVCDPEIPILTIKDLGILRDVNTNEAGQIEVFITPTYSGCPAMDTISINIKAALEEHGYTGAKVKSVLSPAWTTAWMTEEGKQKLKAYGIAPPVGHSADKSTLFAAPKQIQCPHCGAQSTKLISQFGSTPCKALYRCEECLEPFDYFKCH